jgi:hypothetical protein
MLTIEIRTGDSNASSASNEGNYSLRCIRNPACCTIGNKTFIIVPLFSDGFLSFSGKAPIFQSNFFMPVKNFPYYIIPKEIKSKTKTHPSEQKEPEKYVMHKNITVFTYNWDGLVL